MPRRQRCRWIGGYPDHWSFSPDDSPETTDCVVLSLDELETIRLIDREELTQEQCAGRMGVARTTVTAIYMSARRKIASAILDGKQLKISGGTYRLRERAHPEIAEKGTNTMRIAVTYENGEVFQHFGHSEHFKLYDVTDGKVISAQVADTNGQGHGALAGFLKQCGADALICGGIGMGARSALEEAGIRLYAGISGSADEAAQALAAGTLVCDPDARCEHHEHHGEGHDCAHHRERRGCGDHACR